MLSMFLVALIVVSLPQPAAAAAVPKNIYVEVGGTGTGTQASPYGSVATALTNAVAGDTIYVGEGTFIGCYTLKAGVSLIGQGAGKTTLQGNGTGSVLYGNSYTTSGVISGFTITGGTGRAMTFYTSDWQQQTKQVGGAIVLAGGFAPLIENNIIRDNDAWGWQQGLGGAVFISNSSPRINNNTISSNRAGSGGAIYVDIGSNPTIENNYISGNTAASYGGAITFEEHSNSTRVAGNTITNNTAGWGGGGIYIDYGAAPNILNNKITNNTASGATGSGGGIYCSQYAAARIINNTITGNTATLYASGIGAQYSAQSVVVKNCIIWGNRKTGTTTPNSIRNVSPTYSCIEEGSGGTGNISSDPLFVDAGSGDYSLQVSSPAVNTGTADGAPSSDFLGTSRPQGAGFDMGALERGTSEVTVPLLDNAVSVTFQGVWKSGDATAEKQPLGANQAPPTGFVLTGDAYYDISPSSATWDRSDQPARVTLRFSDTGLTASEKATIRLFHYKNDGTWEDITDSDGLDLTARTVSGTTTSFSGFGVFYTPSSEPAEGSEPVISVDASSWWALALMAVGGFCAVVINRKRRAEGSPSHDA